MKKQILLSQEDIQQTIANSFNVDNNKVSIEIDEDDQYSGLKAFATVEVPMNEGR